MRLTREEYFMKMAIMVAKRSTCERAQVGAILVDVNRNAIVATGYNGSAPGAPHCIDVGCLIINGHCHRTIHAEMNAICHLEHSYDNLILYCTHQPCVNCTKALAAINVREVRYLHEYNDPIRDAIIEEMVETKRMKMVKVIL
jgi:dCMP deaminase